MTKNKTRDERLADAAVDELITAAVDRTSERGARVELARRVGWDHGKVSRVLAGKQQLGFRDAAVLALALGLQIRIDAR